MANKRPNSITPFRSGFVQDLLMRIKLILRLMGDKRVSPFLKLLPIGSLLYVVIPDLAIGPIDDAAVVGLGMYLFLELCPQEVVEEHMAALAEASGAKEAKSNPEEIIEGEFREE